MNYQTVLQNYHPTEQGDFMLRYEIGGYNYDELYEWAEKLKAKLLTHRRIKEVLINSEFSWWKDDYQEFYFNLNKERMAQDAVRGAVLHAVWACNPISVVVEVLFLCLCWVLLPIAPVPFRRFLIRSQDLHLDVVQGRVHAVVPHEAEHALQHTAHQAAGGDAVALLSGIRIDAKVLYSFLHNSRSYS